MDVKTPRREKAEVHETKELYRGRQFSFVTEDVTLPNGSRSEFAVIRHPGSTGIVPVADDGMIVMTMQYRYAVGEYMLEIPAGTLEKGESPLECARRELQEEVGFAAREFIEIADIRIIPSYSDERIHVYLAKGLTPSRLDPDEDEIIQVVRYPLERLMNFVAEGVITDGLTILSLYQARMVLHGV